CIVVFLLLFTRLCGQAVLFLIHAGMQQFKMCRGFTGHIDFLCHASGITLGMAMSVSQLFGPD
ncbi:hypothetical protein DVA81_19245, partial [Acinetobacter baumannii]